ncbi:MAG: DUF58 domain-containing protein, partial [Gammaproteobacteria bacterium]|nr:DUF58 domain-containing protein [Gammaproteobacteria bacterium]
EARLYQAGDDIRSIDWKVTARTQKTHTKIFRQERERPVHIFVDNRQAMQFATQCCYKSVIAAQCAALVAWKANASSDRVGGMVFSEEMHQEFKPKMGRGSVLQLIHLLSQPQAKPTSPIKNDKQEDVLKHALYRLRETTKPGSLIYLISDFAGLSDQHVSMIAQLSRHNDIVLIFVYDNFEKTMPPAGTYQVNYLSNNFAIQTKDKKIRNQYEQAFLAHEQRLKTLAIKHQMHFKSVSTAQKPIEEIR